MLARLLKSARRRAQKRFVNPFFKRLGVRHKAAFSVPVEPKRRRKLASPRRTAPGGGFLIKISYFSERKNFYASACTACKTSAAWPSTFTFGQIFAIRPRASTSTVERSMPIYFLPYMDFSCHAP